VAGDPELSRIILLYASAYDIPLPLAFALAWGESQFNPQAFNRNPTSVDRGLFQLNSLAFPRLPVEEFYDPRTNARLGMKHLRFCLDSGGNELVGLAMYNAGNIKVRRGGTPYNTLTHIARILDYRKTLEEEFLRAVLKHPGVVSLL
jgi:soluble lytic murein transglycosylase-like protein